MNYLIEWKLLTTINELSGDTEQVVCSDKSHQDDLP